MEEEGAEGEDWGGSWIWMPPPEERRSEMEARK
jgi:hypothetical protein